MVTLGNYEADAAFSIKITATGLVDIRVEGLQWTSSQKPTRALEATVMLFKQGPGLSELAPLSW